MKIRACWEDQDRTVAELAHGRHFRLEIQNDRLHCRLRTHDVLVQANNGVYLTVRVW